MNDTLTMQDVRRAVNHAREQIAAADSAVNTMAYLCTDRLQSAGVGHPTLCRLKRELARYNMHTGRWRE